eukprot:COSAG03_NODE_178_length_11063_cov_43.316951_4_plen_189_part_00
MAALSDATVTVAVRLFSSESNAISPKHSPLLYERTFSLQSDRDQSNISRQANQPAVASRSKGQHNTGTLLLLLLLLLLRACVCLPSGSRSTTSARTTNEDFEGAVPQNVHRIAVLALLHNILILLCFKTAARGRLSMINTVVVVAMMILTIVVSIIICTFVCVGMSGKALSVGTPADFASQPAEIKVL